MSRFSNTKKQELEDRAFYLQQANTQLLKENDELKEQNRKLKETVVNESAPSDEKLETLLMNILDKLTKIDIISEQVNQLVEAFSKVKTATSVTTTNSVPVEKPVNFWEQEESKLHLILPDKIAKSHGISIDEATECRKKYCKKFHVKALAVWEFEDTHIASMKPAEISKKYGVSLATASNWKTLYAVKFGKPIEEKKPYQDKDADLGNMSINDIAILYDIKYATATTWKKKWNLKFG